MGCIRVDKITEYLCEPLRKCLKDEDPYVRKTAAVCVAKLHDINSQLVEDQGFLDSLRELLSDSNPMVCFLTKFSILLINLCSILNFLYQWFLNCYSIPLSKYLLQLNQSAVFNLWSRICYMYKTSSSVDFFWRILQYNLYLLILTLCSFIRIYLINAGGCECCGCNIRDNGDFTISYSTCRYELTDYQQTVDGFKWMHRVCVFTQLLCVAIHIRDVIKPADLKIHQIWMWNY